MHGLHLTSDLYACSCDSRLLTDPVILESMCRTAVADAGLTYVEDRFYAFPGNNGNDGGVTGAVLLAESHLALHTWPESGAVTLDVYVCNYSRDNSGRAEQLVRDIVARFQPGSVEHNRLTRGEIPAPSGLGERLQESLSDQHSFVIDGAHCVHREVSVLQTIEVFDTEQFGRLLRLDGTNMTSERDEFFYHEALVHPLALCHPAPRSALIIGGGDGGAAEELLKIAGMERVLMVEIDEAVPRVAREYLSAIHRGAFDDPRLQVLIMDGERFVRETDERFDLVLLDLTDPDTPARALYTEDFFRQVKRCLRPGGGMSMHVGSPVFHPQRMRRLIDELRRVFRCVQPLSLYVPLYGTQWGMATASDTLQPAALDVQQVDQRLSERGLADLDFYNGATHQGLFALPNYVRKLLA